MKGPAASAIAFLLCLTLGWQALRQKAELARLGLEAETDGRAEQRQIASLRREIAAVDTAVPAKVPAVEAGLAPRDAPVTVHLSDVIREHPEYAAIRAKEIRRNILYHYGEGLAGLKLPPVQLARLKDLLVERGMRMGDAQEAADAMGLDQGSAAYRTAMSQAGDGLEQEIAALLGTDSRQFIQRLDTLNVIRNQIQGSYALDFEDADAPLTADQARGLEQGMAEAKNDLKPQDTLADPASGLSPLDRRILAAATPVLSPAQLQILKADRIEDNQQMAIARQYHIGITVYSTH